MPTRKLAEYVDGLSFSTIPDSAMENCKKVILDTLGVAIRGSRTEHGKIFADFAKEFDGKKESRVIGYGYKASCLNTAFANSVMAHAIDFDDIYEPGIIHVACVLVPVALATGEVRVISGKELLTAIVGGYDVSCRVASSVAPFHHTPLGHHTTGTANCLGAAAVAGKTLGLSLDELINAFGIAGDSASGLRQYHDDGGMLKQFHAGKAAQNGILAALLAKRGFISSPRILEGRYGFCRVLSPEHYSLGELTNGLGEEFRVNETSFKPFPSCRFTNGSIDAALSLKWQNNLEARDIERVTLRAFFVTVSGNNKPSPQTALQALLSHQYCIAIALVKGTTVSVDDFWVSERLNDERVRELMKRIEVVEDPALTRLNQEKNMCPLELEVVMKSGEVLTQRVDYLLGSPNRPMSDQDLIGKFKGLASSVLSEKKLEELMDSIMNLEIVGDVRELTELLY